MSLKCPECDGRLALLPISPVRFECEDCKRAFVIGVPIDVADSPTSNKEE